MDSGALRRFRSGHEAVKTVMAIPAKRFGHVALALAACAMLASGQQASGAADKIEAEGIIFERQQVMTQLDKDAETLGDIVAGLAPADKLGATTRAIAQGAHDSVEAFKSQVPGGRSKPEVWSNNQDFTAKMALFASKADAMAELAKGGNVAAVASTLAEALPCKGCHDTYRAPKKP